MRSVFSMLPDGMRKASTSSERTTSQITSATAIDLTHSHADCPTVRDGLELSATLILLHLFGLFPFGQEDIGLSRRLPITVGSEDEFLPVRRKHREAVEVSVGGHLGETGSVQVDQEEIEVSRPGVWVIRSKDESFSVRRKIGCEVGAAELGDLPRVGAIGVRHPKLHLGGAHQVLLEQILIVGLLFLRLGLEGAPRQHL